MELDDCIAKRHSIRKYAPKVVPVQYIAKIIKAGISAPNAGNLQEWRFVVITDEKVKDKIAVICEDQTWMINTTLFVICSDNRDMERFYGERGKKIYAVQDAAAAAENMVLKAYDLGLGSCWVTAFNEETLRELLALPDFVAPHLILAIGHPEEKGVEKPKLKVEDVIHLNQYGKRAVEYPEMGEMMKRLVEKGKSIIKRKPLQHA